MFDLNFIWRVFVKLFLLIQQLLKELSLLLGALNMAFTFSFEQSLGKLFCFTDFLNVWPSVVRRRSEIMQYFLNATLCLELRFFEKLF